MASMTNDERQVLLKLCESFIGLADSQLETHRLVFSIRDALTKQLPGLDSALKESRTESLWNTTFSSQLRQLRQELEGFLGMLRRPSDPE
jgi:hypothetical protein